MIGLPWGEMFLPVAGVWLLLFAAAALVMWLFDDLRRRP